MPNKRTVAATLSVSVAWWLKLYLYLLTTFCWLMNTEPDPDKLNKKISKGIRVRVGTRRDVKKK